VAAIIALEGVPEERRRRALGAFPAAAVDATPPAASANMVIDGGGGVDADGDAAGSVAVDTARLGSLTHPIGHAAVCRQTRVEALVAAHAAADGCRSAPAASTGRRRRPTWR